MSGHCDFCGVWHSGSCSHPGRQWKERAERAEAERDALRRDVRQYLKAFVHYHVNNGTDDACKQCGLDLRNPVHSFVDVAEVIAPALREKP